MLPIGESSNWAGVIAGLLVGLWVCRCCWQLSAQMRTVRQQLDWEVMLNQLFASALETEPVLHRVVEQVRQVVRCDRTTIYRLDNSWHGTFIAESVADGLPSWLCEPSSTALQRLGIWHKGQMLYSEAFDHGPQTELSTVCVNDVAAQTNPRYYQPVLSVAKATAYCAIPLYQGSQLWGLLLCYQHQHPRHWRRLEQERLEQLGQQLGRFIQRSTLAQQQQQQLQTLQADKDAALSANQSKSDFLAYMSHELRTPLNAILGFAQVLQREAVEHLPTDQRQSVDIIERSGEHLLRLVNDILDMSKIEAGQMVLNEQKFDLHQLLTTLEDMLRLRAEGKGIDLTFKYQADTPQFIHADEQKLRQILLNLLGNAIKFTQVGGVTCRVWAESLEADSQTENPIQLFIAVEDTGPGIDSEELDSLFEAFHQVREAGRQQEGTGLGLTISRRFVQLMGGKLGVISEQGSGSTFTVRIPCQWVQAQPQVAVETPATLPTQRYRMLVTDDDATSRLLLTKLFGAMGHEIKQAKNGREAVEVWQRWKPDLVWMDIRMPLMDGCEATQRIKAADTANQTVVIALTASAFEEQRQMMLASGCVDFVRKPFKREELLSKIRQHLAEPKKTQRPLSLPQAS
ncbi:MAG: ATP-binding protein [Cyanobacteria bacterium J06628_6]